MNNLSDSQGDFFFLVTNVHHRVLIQFRLVYQNYMFNSDRSIISLMINKTV